MPNSLDAFPVSVSELRSGRRHNRRRRRSDCGFITVLHIGRHLLSRGVGQRGDANRCEVCGTFVAHVSNRHRLECSVRWSRSCLKEDCCALPKHKIKELRLVENSRQLFSINFHTWHLTWRWDTGKHMSESVFFMTLFDRVTGDRCLGVKENFSNFLPCLS